MTNCALRMRSELDILFEAGSPILSLDLTNFRTESAGGRTLVTLNFCMSCMKRQRRATVASRMSRHQKFFGGRDA